MVKGLELFQTHFKDYQENYTLIGGTACHLHMDELGLEFRSTQDLDIVLVIEAITPEFVTHFWEFINAGDYSYTKQTNGEDKTIFYRFTLRNSDSPYPKMLELFTKNDDIELADNQRAFPVAEDSDESLSAMLIDNEFYPLIISNLEEIDGVTIISVPALIILKMHAFNDFTRQKSEGVTQLSRQIKKHKLDVFRLSLLLDSDSNLSIPPEIVPTLNIFIAAMVDEEIDMRNLEAGLGLPNSGITKNELLDLMKSTFNYETLSE